MTKETTRRAFRLIATAMALALTGAAVHAATGQAGNQTYVPREGFSRIMGSKTAVGYFETVGGRCAVTLMIAETFSEDQQAPASASRLRLSLVPSQSFDLSSLEVQGVTMRCGADGRSLSVATPPAASM